MREGSDGLIQQNIESLHTHNTTHTITHTPLKGFIPMAISQMTSEQE